MQYEWTGSIISLLNIDARNYDTHSIVTTHVITIKTPLLALRIDNIKGLMVVIYKIKNYIIGLNGFGVGRRIERIWGIPGNSKFTLILCMRDFHLGAGYFNAILGIFICIKFNNQGRVISLANLLQKT